MVKRFQVEDTPTFQKFKLAVDDARSIQIAVVRTTKPPRGTLTAIAELDSSPAAEAATGEHLSTRNPDRPAGGPLVGRDQLGLGVAGSGAVARLPPTMTAFSQVVAPGAGAVQSRLTTTFWPSVSTASGEM